MSIREKICEIVTMHDALRLYHHEGRKGRVNCPIHNGNDNNFCYTDKVFHCWVCGASGSVIDFVMQLFDIDFRAACLRLNYDFGLNITAETPDPHTAAKFARERRERARRTKEIGNKINALCAKHRRLWEIIATQRPDRERGPSPEWVDAVGKIEYVEYQIQELQKLESQKLEAR